MNNKDPHPKKGDIFYFQAEIINVKYKGDSIVIRLEEFYSKSKFNLIYNQQKLPGME